MHVDRLLAYAAAYPNNELVFTACDMILFIQSDASYLSRANARSVVGGIFYLGNAERPTEINGAVNAISNIIDVVVASAAEAEYAGAFINAQKGECMAKNSPSCTWIPTASHPSIVRQRGVCSWNCK